jgi:cation diffusion facilitator CzcD-associated flavoprotein CzcO
MVNSPGEGGPEPSVAIVGSGVSGICLAAKMKQAGFANFTIFEKADEVGGTWRDNRYPGLTCDIASRYYSFTFAPNANWSKTFSPGPEIHEYLKKVVGDFDIRRHVKFRTEVTGARWNGKAWVVTDGAGEETEFDFLVSASGILHYPSFPSIPGLDSFEGELFHTAQWKDTPLRGRRVAVIGTGSSGVQVVGALAGEAGELLHFSRTPQWMIPMFNPRYPAFAKRLRQRMPRLDAMSYRAYQVFNGNLATSSLAPGWQRTLVSGAARLNLRRIRDPKLRAALTPDYQPGCKRMIVSSRYYTAIQQDHVSLVQTAIDRIDPKGIVTSDGTLHEVDVIVLATGFEFYRPMQHVVGETGQTLDEAWKGSPKNYLTVAMAGFPNFFMINGPPIAFASICDAAETYAGYVVKWLEKARDQHLDRVVVTQAAQDRFQTEMRKLIPQTVFVAGCESYYLAEDGTPGVLPIPFSQMRATLSELNLDDFELEAAVGG